MFRANQRDNSDHKYVLCMFVYLLCGVGNSESFKIIITFNQFISLDRMIAVYPLIPLHVIAPSKLKHHPHQKETRQQPFSSCARDAMEHKQKKQIIWFMANWSWWFISLAAANANVSFEQPIHIDVTFPYLLSLRFIIVCNNDYLTAHCAGTQSTLRLTFVRTECFVCLIWSPYIFRFYGGFCKDARPPWCKFLFALLIIHIVTQSFLAFSCNVRVLW